MHISTFEAGKIHDPENKCQLTTIQFAIYSILQFMADNSNKRLINLLVFSDIMVSVKLQSNNTCTKETGDSLSYNNHPTDLHMEALMSFCTVFVLCRS